MVCPAAPADPRSRPPVLAVERVDVGADAVVAVVRCDPDRLRTSAFPGLSDRAFQLLPGLRGHTCENAAGAGIGEELADTEVAHLFEHCAVELMALAGSRGTRGETRWDFRTDGRGVFRVTLAYDDDLVALGALKTAAACVAWLTGEGERPDVESGAALLRQLRAR